ncbi:MAG: type II toxin-antitoxin system HipA family toxin [Hyphomicrobiales bacterium]|nr:type II toxin-antitoxin system HipA family toxin [Hyphomicrobiales bacterium]
MPEAIVAIGEGKRVVGKLRFESDGRRQHSLFEYDDDWLSAKDRFALSPGLPLRAGGHYASGRVDRRSALPGCFSDAAPDTWGRALMTRALGSGLSEYDYLVLSDDKTRHGALRFLGEDMEPLSTLSPPVPRIVDLEELRDLARRFERDPGVAEAEARDLAGVAGSLGGERPKANVEGDGHLWIAKFTSEHDTKPIERVEVATLKLATSCGLRAAEAHLEPRDSEAPIALLRRFDRKGEIRIPYISARTALQHEGDDAGCYTDIADVMRQISKKAADDLRELWLRIVFTVLVSNTDDHLKNHGFIYAGEDRWRLSPAFDINPSPSRHRVLETAIIEGGSFDASIELVLDAAQFFEVPKNEAKHQIIGMAKTITDRWREFLTAEGVRSEELELYAEAFEHEQMELALGLT